MVINPEAIGKPLNSDEEKKVGELENQIDRELINRFNPRSKEDPQTIEYITPENLRKGLVSYIMERYERAGWNVEFIYKPDMNVSIIEFYFTPKSKEFK